MDGARRVARGRAAERIVASYLEAQGFAVLGRNVRLGPLELDLVARKGPLVVAVEVRTRSAGSFAGPFASVGAKKKDALLRATERFWRERLHGLSDVQRMRIDVAAVVFGPGEPQVLYHPGAVVG